VPLNAATSRTASLKDFISLRAERDA